MAIDPVILLVEELRSTELALSKATKLYNGDKSQEYGEVVNRLLSKVRRQWGELYETVPTSCLGAAELVGIAAQMLPFAYSRYASHLHNIADRLSMGQRTHSDLVWLRAMLAALSEGLCGKDGSKSAPLLNLAILGAAKPVVVFRAVNLGHTPWQDVLVRLN